MLPSEVSMKGMDVRGGILEPPLGLIFMSSGNLNCGMPLGIWGPLNLELEEFYDYLGKG